MSGSTRVPSREQDRENSEAPLGIRSADPVLKNVDISFDKFFPFGDRANIQLRFEVYNLLNTANLGIPTVDIASSAFGRIGRTATPAREFQFGIKVAY